MLVEGLQYGQACPEIYTVCCTLITRLLHEFPKFNCEETVKTIGQFCTVDMGISVELLIDLVKKRGEGILKPLMKTSLIKFLMKNYINTILKQGDRLTLYRSLKLCKYLSNVDKNFLRSREQCLSDVILVYEQYVPVIQEILSHCFERSYCQEIYSKFQKVEQEWIDKMHVWSHEKDFCQALVNESPDCVKKVEELIIKGDNTQDAETELYTILANLAKFMKIISQVSIPPKHTKSLKSSLKLGLEATQDQLKAHKNINVGNLENAVEKSVDPMVPRLYQQFMKIYQKKEVKIGSLDASMLDIYSEKNAHLLIEKASQKPIRKEDFNALIEILAKKYPKNQFEADCLNLSLIHI